MSEKVQNSGSKLDTLKWIVVALLVAAGVYGNSYFSGESVLYRVIGLLVLALIAGFIATRTSKGSAFLNLCMDARTEIRKVVWPTRTETIQTTLIVIVVVLLVALLLWGVDSLLSWIISLIIG